MDRFGASIPFDYRLAEEDIEGSIAQAYGLSEAGILSQEECETIKSALLSILDEVKRGNVEFQIELEDIHTNIEGLLEKKIGSLARKLHTGRSRNDQVALDMRLFVKKQIRAIIEAIRGLQEVLVDRADGEKSTIMPAYTHLQRAQPVLFSHHLMAYFEMLQRDAGRFSDCLARMDEMPLGSGAAAGTSFSIPREKVAEALGFSTVTRNSLDAVSDRDFVLEFLAAASILMIHLSRLCEEIVLWSSEEFGFIELDDAHATGSSMMPQKKNPDVAELIRGKSGRVVGDLMGLLMVMKGLPLAYNKDMQEDKEALFDAADTIIPCLEVLTLIVKGMKIKRDRMRAAASQSYITATDIADYLVKRGVPFRDAHRVAGRIVLYCVEQGILFEDLTLDQWKSFSDLFDEDIRDSVSLESSIKARACIGGTAPEQVSNAIAKAKEILYIERNKNSIRSRPEAGG